MNSSQTRARTALKPAVWLVRSVAVGCLLISVTLAILGFRLLFAGDWLESHAVRYGPLALLAVAAISAIAAIVLALVGAIRRPRDPASWIVLAIIALPVPLSILVSQMLGI